MQTKGKSIVLSDKASNAKHIDSGSKYVLPCIVRHVAAETNLSRSCATCFRYRIESSAPSAKALFEAKYVELVMAMANLKLVEEGGDNVEDYVELVTAMTNLKVVEEGDDNKENNPPSASEGASVMHPSILCIP